jgi:hypothetical protein
MTRWFAYVLLAVVLVGCQAAPQPQPPPVQQVASVAIWAEVPRQICTCHEEALGHIETVVQDSDLPLEFKLEGGDVGWHVFSVTFDPTLVSEDRVTGILQDAGALIIPAPAR